MKKNFVGFGCGPIQTGLMLLEACRSGNFGRFVIAEIDQRLVDAVRSNGNSLTVNIARDDGVERVALHEIEMMNPSDAADRAALGAAIEQADEMATAIPSVMFYTAGGDSSIVRVLSEHINPARKQIIYASENNNYAAEILRDALVKQCGESRLANLRILNTVIGKMSGVIQDPAVIQRLSLAPMVKHGDRAVLVEEFNRILVSRVDLPGYVRGITAFAEKDNLLPFEEAKLYGHNAIHALLGYLASERGYSVMSDIRDDAELMELGRGAFIEESGEALVRKYRDSGEPLFTPAGYRAYAEDLLERMTNPFLNDEIARVCRDPGRKLGYSDRIIGAMREALARRVEPRILALGAASGLRYIVGNQTDLGVSLPASVDAIDHASARAILAALWRDEQTDRYRDHIESLILERLPDADRVAGKRP